MSRKTKISQSVVFSCQKVIDQVLAGLADGETLSTADVIAIVRERTHNEINSQHVRRWADIMGHSSKLSANSRTSPVAILYGKIDELTQRVEHIEQMLK